MKKSTVIAVFVFVGLLVLVLINLDQKTERGITRVSFANLDTSGIDRIVITGENSAEIRKIDEAWRMGDGHEADRQAVDRLIQTIPKIQSSQLVTEDPSRYEELGVDDEKGVHLAIFAKGKKAADFVVGKPAPGGVNLRVDESVYLVSKLARSVFSKKTTQWYKLKLFDSPIDQVERVEVIRPEGAVFGLVKQEKQWQFQDPNVVPKGFRFDPAAARSLVSALINVRASRIVLDEVKPTDTGLEGKHRLLVFVTKDGKRHELHLGAENEKKEVFVRVGDKTELYLLNQYTVRNLDKQATDLRDMKLVDLDVDRVVRLSIRKGPKTLSLDKHGAEWKIEKITESIPPDFQLDQQSVTRRLTSMANAKGVELVSGKSKPQTGLKRPKTAIKAVLDNGSEVSIVFGSKAKMKNGEGYYAIGNMDQKTYLVSKYTHDTLLGLLSSFKKRTGPEGMPNIDPKTLSKLPPDLREKILRQMRQKERQQKMIEAARKR